MRMRHRSGHDPVPTRSSKYGRRSSARFAMPMRPEPTAGATLHPMTAALPTMNPLQPAIDEMLHAMRVGCEAMLEAGAAGTNMLPPTVQSFSRPDEDDELLARMQMDLLRSMED